jgi:hypothetical protein
MPGRDHAFSAMAAVSLLILFNIATIIGYFSLFNISNVEKYKIPLFVFAITVLVINYYVFIHKKKFEKIEAIFINESKEQKRTNSVIVIAYVLLTFIFLFWVLINK